MNSTVVARLRMLALAESAHAREGDEEHEPAEGEEHDARHQAEGRAGQRDDAGRLLPGAWPAGRPRTAAARSCRTSGHGPARRPPAWEPRAGTGGRAAGAGAVAAAASTRRDRTADDGRRRRRRCRSAGAGAVGGARPRGSEGQGPAPSGRGRVRAGRVGRTISELVVAMVATLGSACSPLAERPLRFGRSPRFERRLLLGQVDQADLARARSPSAPSHADAWLDCGRQSHGFR